MTPKLFLTIMVTTSIAWGASLDPEIIEKINAFAEQVVSCRNIAGMSVSAVKDGEVVYSNGFGVIDLESKRPVTPETLFGIASVSKQFTTTLLGKFLHDNK